MFKRYTWGKKGKKTHYAYQKKSNNYCKHVFISDDSRRMSEHGFVNVDLTRLAKESCHVIFFYLMCITVSNDFAMYVL